MSNAIEIATPLGLLIAYRIFLFFIAVAYTLTYCLNNSDCYFVGGGMIAALVLVEVQNVFRDRFRHGYAVTKKASHKTTHTDILVWNG
jgi:hypothetical protein